MSSALATLDAPYLPLVVQEAAGVPLDPGFAEQKRILERCDGLFYRCAGGAEARRFNRLLIEAGPDQGDVTRFPVIWSRLDSARPRESGVAGCAKYWMPASAGMSGGEYDSNGKRFSRRVRSQRRGVR